MFQHRGRNRKLLNIFSSRCFPPAVPPQCEERKRWFHLTAQELQPLHYEKHLAEGGWLRSRGCQDEAWSGGGSLVLDGLFPAARTEPLSAKWVPFCSLCCSSFHYEWNNPSEVPVSPPAAGFSHSTWFCQQGRWWCWSTNHPPGWRPRWSWKQQTPTSWLTVTSQMISVGFSQSLCSWLFSVFVEKKVLKLNSTAASITSTKRLLIAVGIF